MNHPRDVEEAVAMGRQYRLIDRNAFIAKRELRRLAITMKGNITRSYHRKLVRVTEWRADNDR